MRERAENSTIQVICCHFSTWNNELECKVYMDNGSKRQASTWMPIIEDTRKHSPESLSKM